MSGYWDDDENITTFLSGDYNASNAYVQPLSFAQGWIYIVDSVLSVPQWFSKDAVTETVNGTSFVAALEKTGLTEQFDSLHGATYFIPVDEGWAMVEDALAGLSNDNLTELLKYHAADSVWIFDDWKNGTEVTTLNGQKLTFTQTPDEEWFINNAGVNDVDLFVSGGVIVLIDSVLNPYKGYAAPLNGTDGTGVPAWPVSENATATSSAAGGFSTASSTASATPSVATGAAVSLKAGAIAWAAFLGAAALALL